MQYSFTPGSLRAIRAAAQWSAQQSDCSESEKIQATALLLGLLAEKECRAAILLAQHGIDEDTICHRWPHLTFNPSGGVKKISSDCFATDTLDSFRTAAEHFADFPQPLEFATEHVLLGLVAAHHEVAQWLQQQGLDFRQLDTQIRQLYGHCLEPLDVELAKTAVNTPENPIANNPTEGTQSDRLRLLRVIDAAANRAREGLRAVEDYARFVLDDRHLTECLKQMRHDLTSTLAEVPLGPRLAARETQADVGTTLVNESELRRSSAQAVLTANFTRLQEALRSLEEFGKVLNPAMARRLEQLRYRSYTLQRAVEITKTSVDRLENARLYVLVDGQSSAEQFSALVRELIDAGADVLQLRDKRLNDRKLLTRARQLRELTANGRTLFIMNDRPDLAVLSHADGVHVGQEELSVKDARGIVGPERLVGVSTHSIEQAQQAVLDGANYIGVGPTFPSETKQFDEYTGLPLLRAVTADVRLPAFAIGGITSGNLPEVLATGLRRIAVSSAVTKAADPATATRELKEALQDEYRQ